MNNNPKQPRKFDAVLGGNRLPPVNAAVLGGIEGVKSRLQSGVVEAQVAALSEALNYGDAGLDLVIDALQDSANEVKHFAVRLLKQRGGEKGKQALINYDPYLAFTMMTDWLVEVFNSEVGILCPENKAYAVQFQGSYSGERLSLDPFYTLLEDPNISKIEAFICQIEECQRSYQHDSYSFRKVLKAIYDASVQLSNLKGLFIGDAEQHEYRKSNLDVFDIRPILEALPNLELLQVRGRFTEYLLNCEYLKHENLKTLIVETADISDKNFEQICALDLLNLEYLELWCGRRQSNKRLIIDYLTPILSGEAFPELAYLGLCSSEFSDLLAEKIVQSPIIERLLVLDLSRGNLKDGGAEFLLKCPAINQLQTLNIANNCVSDDLVQQLLQLDCQVIADEQEVEGERGCGDSRYFALHE